MTVRYSARVGWSLYDDDIDDGDVYGDGYDDD